MIKIDEALGFDGNDENNSVHTIQFLNFYSYRVITERSFNPFFYLLENSNPSLKGRLEFICRLFEIERRYDKLLR